MIIKTKEIKEKIKKISEAPRDDLLCLRKHKEKLNLIIMDFARVSTYVDANVSELGERVYFLPFKKITNLISKINSEEIDFTFEETQLVIKSGKSKFKFSYIESEKEIETKLKKEELLTKFTFGRKDFERIIKNVFPFIGDANSRPILEAINFKNIGKNFEFVATNSYKLSKETLVHENDINDFEVNLHHKFVNNLIKLNGDIQFTLYESCIVAQSDGMVIIAPYISGQYPSTDKLILPKEELNEVIVDKKTILNAIERLSVFDDDLAVKGLLKLSIEGQELNISISGTTTEGYEILELEEASNLKSYEIHCSLIMLKSTISLIETQNVHLFFSEDKNRQFFIYNKDEECGSKLILPIRV